VPAPTAGIARAAGVVAAADSVVKVLGSACGLGIEGSGWVAAPELVVTNAHVVAGQKDTRVLLRGRQPGLDAQVLAFDPKNDVSVLRVPGLKADPLSIVQSPKSGTSAAILGFPGNGPYDVRAGRIGATREVITQDAYGQGPVRRSITSLRGAVRSGNSGGPMVDSQGRVVTTVFAATTSGPRGGFGVPNAQVRAALEKASHSSGVSTGPCTG
jgi:S1-C subfamily serine protease